MSTNERDDDDLFLIEKEFRALRGSDFRNSVKEMNTRDLQRLFTHLQHVKTMLEVKHRRAVRLAKSDPRALANVRVQLTVVAMELSGRGPASKQASDKAKRIVLPPRLVFDGLLRRLMSPGAYDRYIKPVIADMHHEYFECLAKKDEMGARWAVIRGHLYVIPSWCRISPLRPTRFPKLRTT